MLLLDWLLVHKTSKSSFITHFVHIAVGCRTNKDCKGGLSNPKVPVTIYTKLQQNDIRQQIYEML